MKAVATGAGLVATSQRGLQPFRLHRPVTVQEATAAYASEGPGATYAMGTTDLVAQLREGLRPTALISLSRVPALRLVGHDAGTLSIGAAVDHHAGAHHPLVRANLPGLADAWGRIANVRIRFRATLGGNLMAMRPRYEMSTILDALEAEVHFETNQAALVLSASEIWAGDAPDGALLTEVRIPRTGELSFAYDRSLRPLITLAAAVRRHPGGTRLRIVVGSEYRRPAAVAIDLQDRALDQADLESVARHAASELPDWVGDAAASVEYRRRVAAVQLRRMLHALQAKGPA